MTNLIRGGVVVIDFGAQYAQLIARRVREAGVFSEIMPHTSSADQIASRCPAAIILSGGPSSVYVAGAPRLAPGILDLDLPIFGICYGFQVMARELDGLVEQTGTREYGATRLEVTESKSRLFSDLPDVQTVWMSHGDSVVKPPIDFEVVAATVGTPVAAFEHRNRPIAGVQFHPEVMHSEYGQRVLEHFLFDIAGCAPTWSPVNIIDEQIAKIRNQVGTGHVICGLSGGVDSAVAAALVQQAIGDQLTCVFVDHGLLRKGEAEQVEKDFVAATGVHLVVENASAVFLEELADKVEPEVKRITIGREFIRAFERAAQKVVADAGESVDFLVQGTLYPDVVESGGGSGTEVIKSHHNVGGLPDDLKFKLIEPLRDLFKDEVREIGRQLGLPDVIVGRQPFPGPGLAIRIIGEVTAERLAILRDADAIAREELSEAGLDDVIWQCPVVLLSEVRSVGVQGDGRTYGHPIVLRPVYSEDAMTADWARVPFDVLARISTRITNEVPAVNRVVLDITSKPPASIEWE